MNNKAYLLFFIAAIFPVFFGCEDPVPKDYVEYKVVEALLIINEPIRNIRITKTLPLFDEYNYDSSLIKNAEVVISDGQNNFALQYKYSDTLGKSGYYYPDTTYLIKQNTTYNLSIKFDDIIITAKTTTPDSIVWVKKTPDPLQYPIDTMHLPATDTISWTKSTSQSFGGMYLISITCLDTTNYGAYLNPPTADTNRRTYSSARHEELSPETSVLNMMPSLKTPIVWSVFKWFGLHDVSVWVPDIHYLYWFQQATQTNKFDKRFGNIKSNSDECFGFLGSAFALRDTAVILKNQP